MSFWTAERILAMRQKLSEGASLAEVGKVLGCTRNAVLGKANRLGILDRPHQAGAARARAERKFAAKPYKRHNTGIRTPPAKLCDVRTHEGEPAFIGPQNDFPQGRACRFIRGSVGIGWQCCGHSAPDIARPYCAFHMDVVYQTASVVRLAAETEEVEEIAAPLKAAAA